MKESYVEYTLAKCDSPSISRVCNVYMTKEELLNAALKGFDGSGSILGQAQLIQASLDFIGNDGYIVSCEFDGDGRKLYHRVLRNLEGMRKMIHNYNDVDWEDMFNTLVELNWLLASKYFHNKNQNNGSVVLLGTPAIMPYWVRNALSNIIYTKSMEYKELCKKYESAQSYRYQFLPLSHPDSDIRELLHQGNSPSDFKEMQREARRISIDLMSLFFALTATAARAETIRRMR